MEILPIGKSGFHGTTEFSRFDRVTCPGCCGCYGWDNFDPKAVSESLKQLLQMKTRIIALSHLWLDWRPAENRSKFPLNGTAEFSRFDYVTCRSCCGCYGWDIFNLKAVSESLKQMLHMKTNIIALSHSRLEWHLAENGSKIPFLWHRWIFTIWLCDLSRLLWLLRLR